MVLLYLEALLALLILIGIVWWTMFSGRHKGELRRDQDAPGVQDSAAPGPAEQASAVQAPAAQNPGAPQGPAASDPQRPPGR